MIDPLSIDNIIESALSEDVGGGDYTSLACIVPGTKSEAKLIAKEKGILCGIDVAFRVFEKTDKSLQIIKVKSDGELVEKNDIVLTVAGDAISILTAERTALNFLQRLSGIATHTHRLYSLIKNTKAQLLDTRKTTPNLRILEKYAVKTGGGINHRFGLFDMMMIKDNHIDFAGGIKNAIERANKYLELNKMSLKIEIEVRDFDELKQVLTCGNIDRIMLDNFTPYQLKEAIQIIANRFETEASGGITEKTLHSYARTGVNFISVGALTHNIKSLDFSLVSV